MILSSQPAEAHLPPRITMLPASPSKDSSKTEIVLSTLPAASDGERMLVVLIQSPSTGSHVELRQQSYGDGVGWFTQSSVCMEPHQVAELRSVLGTSGATAGSSLPRRYRQADTRHRFNVIHAETA
jgi:hypothetical protein